MNYLDEKPEHFAKTAFAKNGPKPQKTNKPQKKPQQGVQNISGMYVTSHL